MLETKQQKKYFTTALVLVVILSLVSFWGRNDYKFVDKSAQLPKDNFDYNAYLASLKVDPAASQKLFEQVLSEEEVQKEVENELQVSQPVKLPVVEEKKLTVANTQDSKAVVDYFQNSLNLFDQLSSVAEPVQEDLFNPDVNTFGVNTLLDSTQRVINEMYAMSVPKDAVGIHKSQIATLESFADLVRTSKSYQDSPDVKPWPRVYHDHVAMDKTMEDYEAQYQKLDQKYSISQQLQQRTNSYAKGNMLVKSANAFGFTLSIDIFQKAETIARAALAQAYVTFMDKFLGDLIMKIENDYRVANFLYYTDSLVSGQYVDDYLQKYVGNNLDRAVIKNFIPQIACGKSQDLTTIFRAKAQQNLGFDPGSLSPDDPRYFQKMAKVGSFLSSDSGWKLYYQDVADQAQAAAEKAAQQELVSSGIKAPRDVSKSAIGKSLSTLVDTKSGAILSKITLGHSTSGSTASNIAKALVQSFINNFLFKGAVLKEQSVCIAIPQISPVLPAQVVPDSATPQLPNENDIYKQYYPTTPSKP